jgi:hypothetical protein
MTATVFLVEYASFGGRAPGGEDDIGGGFPQVPGEILNFTEINATSPGVAHQFHERTSFIKLVPYDGDIWLNFDTGGVGTLVADNRDRAPESQPYYQGVLNSKARTPDQRRRYIQINIIDVS